MILPPLLASVLLLLASLAAQAQSGQTTLSCQPVTQYSNGQPIPPGTLIGYKFSRGASASGPFTLETKPATSCTTQFTGLAVNTIHYFVAVASANGVDSGPSPVATRPIFVPSAPTLAPVTLAGPCFNPSSTTDAFVLLEVCSVAAGKLCDPSQQLTQNGKIYMAVVNSKVNVTPLPGTQVVMALAVCQ